MSLATDGRAQSTLVGAILLFAILIIAFSSYQAFVVPNQNAEVEFNHNQDVQTDMQDLRNSLLSVRSVERVDEGEYEIVSEHRPVQVQLGMQYPARLLALNPPAPTGTLATEEPETNVRLENAEPENPENFVVSEAEVDELFDDFENDGFETRFLDYSPGYNEYRNAPETVFEHSLLYNEFRDGDEQLEIRDQQLITDRSGGGSRLNMILFSGDISRASAQSITIDPETIDGPTAPIRITGEGGEDITLTLPTNAPDLWEDRLDGRQGVKEVDPDVDGVEVTLDGEETHQLRLTRVAVDGGGGDDEFTPIQLADRDPPEIDPGDGTLPGPRVFNAQGPDSGDEPLESGDTFDLTADVSSVGQTENRRGGTTIQAAEWYIEGDDPGEGNANPMDDVDGEYLNDVEVEVEDEVSANELEEGTNTLVIRGQDSRGIWGEDTDSVTVEVDESGDLMADRTDIIDAETTNEAGSIVDFTIETLDDGVVVTGLGIDYETGEGDADRVNNGGNDEVVFSGSDGRFDAGSGQEGIVLGDDPVDFEDDGADGEYAELPEGTTDMTLAEFESDESGRQEVDVSQDVFDVTLVFGDGSRDTYPIQVDG